MTNTRTATSAPPAAADVPSGNTTRQAVRGSDGSASATCPRCAALFMCGANALSCWCETVAVLEIAKRPEDVLGKGCLCEACLRAAISESLSGDAGTV